MNREQLKLASERLYRRVAGTTTRTGPFGEFRSCFAEEVLNIKSPECGVLASVTDSRTWLVVTTDRVIGCVCGRRSELALAGVARVHSGTLDEEAADATVQDNTLIVTTTDGCRFEFVVESGFALGGIWNVLRHLQRAWNVEPVDRT